ncbi:hypothetical protein RhiirA5_442364 [Rhizophagus irregularis]|uniref:Uncharacterized protein n=1 Tax=Rhizophagus irregularis TaxID=588596 RepID=A0A2N0NEU0_9GLOM|nr:hypothetical protein RhiirA5_442364 [Rhizophagus irregularis]
MKKLQKTENLNKEKGEAYEVRKEIQKKRKEILAFSRNWNLSQEKSQGMENLNEERREVYEIKNGN